MNFLHVLSRGISVKNNFHNNKLGHGTLSFLHVLLLFTEILIKEKIYEMSISEPLK